MREKRGGINHENRENVREKRGAQPQWLKLGTIPTKPRNEITSHTASMQCQLQIVKCMLCTTTINCSMHALHTWPLICGSQLTHHSARMNLVPKGPWVPPRRTHYVKRDLSPHQTQVSLYLPPSPLHWLDLFILHITLAKTESEKLNFNCQAIGIPTNFPNFKPLSSNKYATTFHLPKSLLAYI